jgi:hypothetical protein
MRLCTVLLQITNFLYLLLFLECPREELCGSKFDDLEEENYLGLICHILCYADIS